MPKASSHLQMPSASLSIGKFPCDKCDKSFPQPYRLRRHVKEVHDQVKVFKCSKCSKRFFKSSQLARHTSSVHDKIRPFDCPHCDSKFKEKSALKYHLRKGVCLSKSNQNK